MTGLLASCSGRTAENMKPTGETVEVNIPRNDVAEDAEIANGNSEIIVAQPDPADATQEAMTSSPASAEPLADPGL